MTRPVRSELALTVPGGINLGVDVQWIPPMLTRLGAVGEGVQVVRLRPPTPVRMRIVIDGHECFIPAGGDRCERPGPNPRSVIVEVAP